MEDWLKCQISPLVKYRQTPQKTKTNLTTQNSFPAIFPMVTQRLTSREAVPVLNSVTSPEVSRWSCNDVKHWMACLGLTMLQPMWVNSIHIGNRVWISCVTVNIGVTVYWVFCSDESKPWLST